MSYLTLSEIKDFLNVFISSDDDKLQILLNGAEKESLEFMNRTSFAEICETDSNYDSDSATMPDDVRVAVYFLVQRSYQATPEEAKALRRVAEGMLMPYRCEMGI